MPRIDVTQMPFAKLYPLLVNKAVKKGRTRQDVDQVTAWLTGYSPEDIARLEQTDISYADFFPKRPCHEPRPRSYYRQGVRRPSRANSRPADA